MRGVLNSTTTALYPTHPPSQPEAKDQTTHGLSVPPRRWARARCRQTTGPACCRREWSCRGSCQPSRQSSCSTAEEEKETARRWVGVGKTVCAAAGWCELQAAAAAATPRGWPAHRTLDRNQAASTPEETSSVSLEAHAVRAHAVRTPAGPTGSGLPTAGCLPACSWPAACRCPATRFWPAPRHWPQSARPA